MSTTVDTVDYATVGGVLVFVALGVWTPIDTVVIGPLLSGFFLSLAMWRLRQRRLFEALGWVAWAGAAVVLVLGPFGGPVQSILFVGVLVLGIALQFGGRVVSTADFGSRESIESGE